MSSRELKKVSAWSVRMESVPLKKSKHDEFFPAFELSLRARVD